MYRAGSYVIKFRLYSEPEDKSMQYNMQGKLLELKKQWKQVFKRNIAS